MHGKREREEPVDALISFDVIEKLNQSLHELDELLRDDPLNVEIQQVCSCPICHTLQSSENQSI